MSRGRRRFLFCIGGAVLAGAPFVRPEPNRLGNSKAGAASKLKPFERRSHALGSTVSLTAFHEQEDVAHEGLSAAFEELERVEDLMSIYRPDSQLSQLNRDRLLQDPHPYLVRVLRYAQTISRRTGGAFDVTVQPLWKLYAEARQTSRLPSTQELTAARQAVDWRRVRIARNRIELEVAKTQVTLNGIAQGFAADCVAATLRRAGIDHALIDTGEVGTIGCKPQGQSWKIGIQHPRQEDAYVALAQLQGRCLATSGDYATRFGHDFAHHHLLDPRTGASPGELASASVVATTAMEADALSTAVFILGMESGLRWIETIPGADALLVDKQGRASATSNFPRG